jgi:hypothetical protein
MREAVQHVPVKKVLIGVQEIAGARGVTRNLRRPVVEVTGYNHHFETGIQWSHPDGGVTAVRETVVADERGIYLWQRLQEVHDTLQFADLDGGSHHPEGGGLAARSG